MHKDVGHSLALPTLVHLLLLAHARLAAALPVLIVRIPFLILNSTSTAPTGHPLLHSLHIIGDTRMEAVNDGDDGSVAQAAKLGASAQIVPSQPSSLNANAKEFVPTNCT